ncbi:MAG: hypothetical protein HRT68_01925 [Flavobacteriaceae bacterium]|nr:hypothetical protein [Flavobacteriaceae bacterium]
MKRVVFLIFLFFQLHLVAQQDSLQFNYDKKVLLETEHFIGTDNFDYTYTLSNNVIEKKGRQREYVYNNIQLGEVEHVDITNPLKIVAFYKEQNAVVILDNTLSEITIINFNSTEEFKKVNQATSAFDNNIWVFNEITQQLELYDYIEGNTLISSLPFDETTEDQKSNYNYCWLITKSTIYCYNAYGSIVSEIKNDGFTNIKMHRNNAILFKEDSLSYLSNIDNIEKIELVPQISIKDFSINNETLYIYDGEFVHHFKLLK